MRKLRVKATKLFDVLGVDEDFIIDGLKPLSPLLLLGLGVTKDRGVDSETNKRKRV